MHAVVAPVEIVGIHNVGIQAIGNHGVRIRVCIGTAGVRGCLRRADDFGRGGRRVYRGRVEMGRVEFGARAILGRVFGIVVGEGVGRRVVVGMVLRLAVVVVMVVVLVLVEGIVGGHAPQSTMVVFSVSELHCGPSIGQARLRDGDVRR